MTRHKFYPALAFTAAWLFLAAVASADTLTVTSLEDSGSGTLREAIDLANTNPGPDTITFAVAGTISPLSALPVLSDTTGATTINGGGLITLDGDGLSGFLQGLEISSADNVVEGLTVIRFPNVGVLMTGSGASGNTVRGCYIGTDAASTEGLGNANGVEMIEGASDNLIGGTTPEARNVISGNAEKGVLLYSNGPATAGNKIEGNYIGTNADGSAALGNGQNGVLLALGTRGNIIGGTQPGAGNVISGNAWTGVSIANPTASENLVLGNYIGTDATGMLAVPNAADGVVVENGAAMNTIGGTAPGARNLISGNGGIGVHIYDWADLGTTENVVQGNYIGTDATGTAAVPNVLGGVQVGNGASMNTIGGTQPGAGNVISGNGENGVQIYNWEDLETTGNLVQGNYVGTDAAGIVALGNAWRGVSIGSGCTNNTVGGSTEGARNIVSGNDEHGIALWGQANSGNLVQGNYVGTDTTGMVALGNGHHGVAVGTGCTNNTIGGSTEGARNVICASTWSGIIVAETGTSDIVVQGNYIGVAANGLSLLPNGGFGVTISGGASKNTIGGTETGEGNLISGNGLSGVHIGTWDLGEGASDNVVRGNVITANADDGVLISGVTSLANAIRENAISANDLSGIHLVDGANAGIAAPVITGHGPLRGTASANAVVEIFVDDQDEGQTFLASVTADESGSFSSAVDLAPYAAMNVTATATGADGNTSEFSAYYPLSDGAAPSPVNSLADSGPGTLREAIESANAHAGADTISFSVSGSITLASQLPSLWDPTGGTRIEGGGAVILDGSAMTSGPRGLLISSSGNVVDGLTIVSFPKTGITILGENATDNVVSGCRIGTDGTAALGNSERGIWIKSGAANNVVGGTTESARNIVSGNAGDGVLIEDDGSSGNVLLGNYIGTDINGSEAIPNGGQGVRIAGGASHNTVGGLEAGAGNLISGNAQDGVGLSGKGAKSGYGEDGGGLSGKGTSGNTIQGNFIGVDATGKDTLANGDFGVAILYRASDNLVGGTDPRARNIISGNALGGVGVAVMGTDGNVIQGNYIGTDVDGMEALPNAIVGVGIADGAANNIIGGTAPGAGNLISGNGSPDYWGGIGIGVYDSDEGPALGTIVQGNYIGVDRTGEAPLGNANSGIVISDGSTGNIIGGTEDGAANLISANQGQGVTVNGGDTSANSIRRNAIFGNRDAGIGLIEGANGGIQAPMITARNPIEGTAPPNAILDLFADDEDEGRVFLASTTANASGDFLVSLDLAPYAGMNITATATDEAGNTSEFSIPENAPEEGEPVTEGEGNIEAETALEAEPAPDGEAVIEGEAPVEGAAPAEGEAPSEGEVPAEGAIEPPPTDEGEAEPAGEGEGESTTDALYTLLDAAGDGLSLEAAADVLGDEELAQALFDELDLNSGQGDGLLTEDELQAAILLKQFDALDVDGDGSLSLAEAQVALDDLDEEAFALLGADAGSGITQDALEQYQSQPDPDEGEASGTPEDGEPEEGEGESAEGENEARGCFGAQKGLRGYLSDLLLIGLSLTVLLAWIPTRRQ